jgi:hypothetical protein
VMQIEILPLAQPPENRRVVEYRCYKSGMSPGSRHASKWGRAFLRIRRLGRDRSAEELFAESKPLTCGPHQNSGQPPNLASNTRFVACR